jgi:hypothetical protein
MKAASSIQLAIRDFDTAASDLEEFCGGYAWTDKFGSISLEEARERVDGLKEFLWQIGAHAQFAEAATPPRAKENWHVTGRRVAALIIYVEREMGLRALSATNESSATAVIGAKAINWAFGLEIEPSGFAVAMKTRDRKKSAKRAARGKLG